MSSILDALKKLEAEKADIRQQANGGFAEEVAERELVGRSPLRQRLTIRLSPITLILGSLAGLAVLAGISAIVTLAVVSRAAPSHASGPAESVQVATSTPVTQPGTGDAGNATPALGAEPVSPPANQDSAPQQEAAVPPQETALPAEPPANPPATAPSPEPSEARDAAPEIVEPEPVPPPVETPSWQGPMIDTSPTVAPIKKPAPPQEKAPLSDISLEDIAELAKRPLRESDKIRLGLAGMQLNMLQPVTKRRPYASAIINLTQVYAGERIPRTDARLVAIDGVQGIVIEMERTNERLYVKF